MLFSLLANIALIETKKWGDPWLLHEPITSRVRQQTEQSAHVLSLPAALPWFQALGTDSLKVFR